jgi:hypothetical protein
VNEQIESYTSIAARVKHGAPFLIVFRCHRLEYVALDFEDKKNIEHE